jgi:uncharacterized protein (TIGR02099 family)
MLRRNLRLKTWLLASIALLVISAGTLVGAVRLLDQAVPGYREEVATWVSDRLAQPLEIGAIELTWTWTGPLLRFDDVVLLEEKSARTVLHLRELGLHFSFWDLLRGIREPDGLTLAGVEVTLHRDDDGRWRLRGLGESGETETLTPEDIDRWLDRVHRVRIEDGRLRVTDAARPDFALDITDIAGTLRNDTPRHRVRIGARLPPDFGGRLELEAFVLGELARAGELQAHVYARIEDLAGARLLQAAGIGDDGLRGGIGEFEVWSDWRRGHFDGARASLRLGAVRLTGNGRKTTVLQPATALDASLAPDLDAGGYRIELDALDTERAGTLPTSGRLAVGSDLNRVEGWLRDLPAELATDWLKLTAPERLAEAAADGMLNELRIRYAGRDDWRIGGTFTALALRDDVTGLDLGRFDGDWSVDHDGGELRVAGGDGAIAVGRYLRGRLPLNALSGRIAWRDTADGRHIEVSGLKAATAGAEIAGGGRLDLPAAGPAVADLTFDVTGDDLPAVLAHIPQAKDLPNPRLRAWLPEAIRAGRITSGRLRLAGPLDRFPMTGDAGEFRVTVAAEDVTLAYGPDWPMLTDVVGDLTIAGDDLDIRAHSGRMLKVPVGPGRAHVADVREPVLKVDGMVRGGDAGRMLEFLGESPLAERFGRLSDVLMLDGVADLTLALSLPLKPELGEPAVSGDIRVDGLRAAHPALPEPLTGLTGNLRFDLDGLYAKDIRAELAGLPLRASIAPSTGDALAVDAEATARLPEHAPALAALKVPEWVVRAASGESRWRIGFEIGAGGRTSDLTLNSDLVGLDLDLPAPLGKSADTVAAIGMTLAADRDYLTLDYGDRLVLDLSFDDGRVRDATVIFGDAEVTPPEGPGWWLGGRLTRVDAAAWHRLLAFDGANDEPPQFQGADLRIDDLRIAGQRLRGLDLNVAPLPANAGWGAEISGAAGHGTLRWLRRPEERDRIEARLQRLRLTPDPQTPAVGNGNGHGGDPLQPATFPILDIEVAALALAGDDFGRLELLTTPVEDGFTLNRLSLSDGVMRLRTQGEWRRADGLTQASLDSRLRGRGTAALLRTLGYTANLQAADAEIKIELRLEPNPQGLTPDTLDGRLSLAMENGSLLAVEPGAGRVLGLVNFYALPRRLLLDFRDVLGKGMAFDKLAGDFKIESGNARTDNLTIETPSAEISIRGRVGLVARDYDQRVTITPQMSGAAAIAGTVLGGPAVGAAVWVAQQLLDKPLSELTRVSYHLTGSWDDPEIREATADE